MAGYNAVRDHLVVEQGRLQKESTRVEDAIKALEESQGRTSEELNAVVKAAGGVAATWDGNGP